VIEKKAWLTQNRGNATPAFSVSQKWFLPLLRGSKFGQPKVIRICKELILQAKSTTRPVGKAAGYE